MSNRNPQGSQTEDGDVTQPGPLPPPPGAKGQGKVDNDTPPSDDPPADEIETATVPKPAKRPAKKAPAKKAPAKKPAVAFKPSDEPEPEEKPAKPAAKRPMTAADYARTTSTDPATTAVFPRVTDDEPVNEQPVVSTSTDAADTGVTRQARLALVHIDPWSVTQLAFIVSMALAVLSIVAVTAVWLVLNFTGVWDNLNDTVNSVLSSEDGTFNVENYLGFGRVLGLTIVLALINVVLMTAVAAVGARLYNAATHLVGGVQVTFRDRG